MADVQVFQMNEYDAVAAKSEEQAREFYLQFTGLSEDEAFPEEITVVPMNKKVWNDETMENKITLDRIIEKMWKGKPFIATTTEW
jgi:hypothetical protein